MKIKHIIFTLFSTSILTHGQSQKTLNTVTNQIYGHWFSSDKHVEITYTEDEIYTLSRDEEITFKAEYQVAFANDSLFIYQTANDFKVKNLVFVNEYELVQANYKSGEKINDHIDEVGVFYKDKANIDSILQNDKAQIKTNFILPKGFKGGIMLAYNQPVGELSGQEEYIKIPASGLLKLTQKTDIYRYGKRRFKFYFDNIDQQNPKNTEIEVLENNKNYTDQELKKYKKDTLYVLPIGYNQLDREGINKIFGENIEGDVEMYEVNYFKNLVKYLKN
jgi:hypothetical protein